jgi:hypothetical protein
MNQQVEQVKNIGEILLVTKNVGANKYKQDPINQVIDWPNLHHAVECIESHTQSISILTRQYLVYNEPEPDLESDLKLNIINIG